MHRGVAWVTDMLGDQPTKAKIRSTFHRAVGNRDLDAVVCLLVDPLVKVNQRNNEGVTPLMTAISRCHVDVVRLFVQRGAATALRDNQGKTANDYAHRVASHKILVRSTFRG